MDNHGPRWGEPGVWAHRRRQACGGFDMGNRKILIPIPNCAQILPRRIHTDFLCQGNFSPQVDVILEGVENDDWEDIAVNVEVFFGN